MKRSPLRRRSKRRAAEDSQRAAVRMMVHACAGGRCAAERLVPDVSCWGPMDIDEIIPRSAWPGGHLDPANCQLLCRAHHEWKHAHPVEAAARGLRRWSWEVHRG